MVFTFYITPWRIMRKLPSFSYHQIVHLSMRKTPAKYDAHLSVFIERHPIISQPLNKLEEKLSKMLRDIEFENSYKSNFELKKEKEQNESQKLKGKVDLSITNYFMFAKELEVWSDKELQSLTETLKSTEDKKDSTSLDKHPDESLFFVMQQKFGAQDVWLPPQTMIQDNETLRQAANRIVKEICGENLKVSLYGEAPIGFEKRSFVTFIDGQEKLQKQKIFYFLAKYVEGHVTSTSTKYQWLNVEELKKVLPEKVYKTATQCLLTSK